MAKPNTNSTTNTGAAPAPAPAETAKRTRLSFSKDKKLAYLLAALVTILTSKAVAAVLTEEQKAKVTKAQESAKELGSDDVLKPVTDRIAAIQSEFKAIDYTKDLDKAAAQAKELALELDKQIKRKKQIEEMIG